MDLSDWDKEAYCRRIKLMRGILGKNQTEFAKFVGIPYKAWHHYERGYPVSRETAFILRKKIDWFSTDWLWHGDMKAIAPGIASQLKELEKAAKKKRLTPTRPLKTPTPRRLHRHTVKAA